MMANDPWLTDHETCAHLGQEIMEKINERNKHSRTSSSYTKLSAEIRISMKRFASDLSQLKQSLLAASSSRHIMQRELERREMMLDSLVTKEMQIDRAFKNASPESRYSHLAGSSAQVDGSPWMLNDDPEEFVGMDNGNVRSHQQQIIQEQDKGLDSLSHVIARQKQMAIDIGDEVDSQNTLIDDIGDNMDRTGERLLRETRHIKIVDRKSNTCGFWIVIILLFVAIVVIAVIPYKKS